MFCDPVERRGEAKKVAGVICYGNSKNNGFTAQRPCCPLFSFKGKRETTTMESSILTEMPQACFVHNQARPNLSEVSGIGRKMADTRN